MKTEPYNSMEAEYRTLYNDILAAGKSVSYSYFLGTTGLLGRFRFCRLDCLCAERQHAAFPDPARLVRLDLKTVPNDEWLEQGKSAEQL